MKNRPVVLAILDGWGVAPDSPGNALTRAKLPNFKRFLHEYPAMTLYASGNEVGLMFGEMGNSEVGHLNIGAGRVYYQSLPRINKEISSGEFFTNKAFLAAVEQVKKNNSSLHLIGLLGPGNVHANQEHLYALLKLASDNKLKKVFIHGVLDGRDTKYDLGVEFTKQLIAKTKEYKCGEVASISGRFYAMDRDNQWDRVEKAYQAIALGQANKYFKDPVDAIESSYKEKIYDEEFVPIVIGKEGKPTCKINAGDAIIFVNFRPDRARQLTEAIVLPGFSKFEREYVKDLLFVTMTEYEKETPVMVAYPPQVVHNCLAEALSKAELTQIHLAETQKYAHVTFFLNGTVEDQFRGEDRILVPSKKIVSFKDAPEMSADEVSKEVIKAVEEGKHDVIIFNLANVDMVGHTGDLAATIKSAEVVDKNLGKIAEYVLNKNGLLFLTADHGNAEEVINLQTGEMDKEHSTNPVPFLVIGNDYQGQAGPSGDAPDGDLSLISPVGMLADVAPTILKAVGVEQPKEMTGRPLI
ncbi:MAG: 2,3-bisphosphoglycerate-independent phosphoglycerate mutase [Candidatus Magasanikbacteria bacterium GW2011_GWC2_37_14]|uniref:2,3-bisphosphoglycerate-independent phosphoglycerate mutase n=1 Tax=Candidatus Magasanikbacteria bacterium GW2011_GWC2_37_14 TaxID=1619046 RepID=A0A0G0JGY8_9BACT|nr:MAG: 2,3-bisphosphoglycerate-independent phosphoglycerate mutase [Candidatus Magasanikbacteria bacterium GW2011_GWC2_37_14]